MSKGGLPVSRICELLHAHGSGSLQYLEDLASSQPGCDGGKTKRRFERERYPGKPGSDTSARLVVTALAEQLLIKATNNRMTEGVVKAELCVIADNYRRLGRHDLADAMPRSYKAMLTMLSDAGQCSLYSFISAKLSEFIFLWQVHAPGGRKFVMINVLAESCTARPPRMPNPVPDARGPGDRRDGGEGGGERGDASMSCMLLG